MDRERHRGAVWSYSLFRFDRVCGPRPFLTVKRKPRLGRRHISTKVNFIGNRVGSESPTGGVTSPFKRWSRQAVADPALHGTTSKEDFRQARYFSLT
jgi:hypothetical protein